jgi:hypothetical protein
MHSKRVPKPRELSPSELKRVVGGQGGFASTLPPKEPPHPPEGTSGG